MTLFTDREQAFETKFIHDAELEFRLFAKQVRLLALWAADQLGLVGDDAHDYAYALVSSTSLRQSTADTVRQIRNDLATHNIHVSDHKIEKELMRCRAEAREKLYAGA